LVDVLGGVDLIGGAPATGAEHVIFCCHVYLTKPKPPWPSDDDAKPLAAAPAD
jgi:hypothetical protein